MKGLFLDLDGTLADTMPTLLAVYHEFLRQRGVQGADSEFWSLAGCSLADCLVALKQNHGFSGDSTAMAEEYYALVKDLYLQKARPMPGAREVLEFADRKRLRVAVVTSSPSSVTRAFLETHRLESLVNGIVGGDSVERGKPHPDPYEKALKLYGLSPGEAVAVEDSAVGAASALAAGVATYLLSSKYSPLPQVKGLSGVLTRLDELIPLID